MGGMHGHVQVQWKALKPTKTKIRKDQSKDSFFSFKGTLVYLKRDLNFSQNRSLPVDGTGP